MPYFICSRRIKRIEITVRLRFGMILQEQLFQQFRLLLGLIIMVPYKSGMASYRELSTAIFTRHQTHVLELFGMLRLVLLSYR
jgi:hypothetical protein